MKDLEVFLQHYRLLLQKLNEGCFHKTKINGRPMFQHDENFNNLSIEDQMYRFMVDYYAKCFPKVLSCKEFKEIKSHCIYHGFSEYEHGAKYLSSDKYHYGTGYMNGTFFTKKVKTALEYTATGPFENDETYGKILTAKISPDAKGIKASEYVLYYRDIFFDLPKAPDPDQVVTEYLVNHCFDSNLAIRRAKYIKKPEIREKLMKLAEFSKRGKDEENLVKLMLLEESPMLVYMGYDYLLDDTYHGHIVVFTRNIVVPDVDYNKFISRAERKSSNDLFLVDYDVDEDERI